MVLAFRPGIKPLDNLAAALARLCYSKKSPAEIAHEERGLREELEHDPEAYAQDYAQIGDADGPSGRVLIFVDQFEEFFTNCTEGDRELVLFRLLDPSLIDADHNVGRIRLLVTLRTDFLDQATSTPTLANAFSGDRVWILNSMGKAGLRQAIVQPARRCNIALDNELVDRILDDVDVRANTETLPLLEFCLDKLWETSRDRSRITAEAYAELGGFAGAVARHADQVFEDMRPQSQRTAELVFRRLIDIVPPGRYTRRQATLDELKALVPDDDAP